MNRFRRGNKSLMKELNRALVVDQIRMKGLISRTDIAKNTELGMSTITNIVDELIAQKLVFEVGTGDSQGGRKPVFLKFNGDYSVVVGVKVEKKRIILCISNLNGHIILTSQTEYSLKPTDRLASVLIQEIERFISHSPHPFRISGIGIAMPGLIDGIGRKIVYSPILTVDHADLSSVVNHFKLPVIMDNDANVFALAEKWIGAGRRYENFIGVTVGSGVGSGIVIQNSLYRGEFGGAGELGHTIIQREGSLCYCGQRGCLESYASDTYLVGEAERLVSMGLPTVLKEAGSITPEAVYTAASNGDPYAQEILLKQGENLGIGLKNMVNLFNPDAIILGGEGLKGKEFLLKGVHKELETHFFARHRRKLHFHVSELGDDVWLIGACALVVSDLFKTPIYR